VSGQDSTNELSVTVGKTVIVDCAKPVTRVTIGLGDYAEASAISRTEILVDGKAPGETSLIIWEQGGERQFFNVTVRPVSTITPDRMAALRRELRTELPGQTVQVSTDNGNIFLRGTVKDLTASERAAQIAGAEGKVVNLLYVAVPPADPQILLKVRFASVDRNRSKQLGINVFSSGLGNVIGSVTTGQFTSTSNSSVNSSDTVTTASTSGNIIAYFPGTNIGATIQALETKGLVEVLAEPNLLAANGKAASFLAGGEYPFPIVQAGSGGGSAPVTIQFKEYGVRLNFIPTITPRGTIRLQVAPEVSSLDFTNAITIAGFEVPAIATRKVKTEVELGEGESFILGGLLDNRETETFQKIPFLGDIPILGKFFSSYTKSRTNSELIVIVTPEIVNPMPTGAKLPELNYPVKFLEPNSTVPMHTPDDKKPGTPPAPAPPTMPVEQLIQSLSPEAPLNSEGYSGSGASSSTAGSSPK
jgi:pilus assembly protein CpaC